jgi:hypothetical protein
LISISFIDISFGFYINTIGIKVNFFLLFVFLFYLTVNGKELSTLFGDKELTEEEKKADAEKLIEMYITQHSNKSNDELQIIVDNPDEYVNSAVIAAKTKTKASAKCSKLISKCYPLPYLPYTEPLSQISNFCSFLILAWCGFAD